MREKGSNPRLDRIRLQIDKMLLEAVESGANIKMDDADWKKLRRAARVKLKRLRKR
jgi:hypothetical protein